MPSEYTVKEVEHITGIPASLLRTWERRYGFPKPQRKHNNFRFFTDKDLVRLLQIYTLHRRGYKVADLIKTGEEKIRELIWEQLWQSPPENFFPQDLFYALYDLSEWHFHHILEINIKNKGFEETVESLVMPFLKHVGDLWFLQIITPVNEHFVSNLIRQKIFSFIDKIQHPVPFSKNEKTWIFFLPEDELHEISLLYYYYLAKKSGRRCLFLGQSVPLNDLSRFMEFVNDAVLVTTFTIPLRNISLHEYLQILINLRPSAKVYYSCRPDFPGLSSSCPGIFFSGPDVFRSILMQH